MREKAKRRGGGRGGGKRPKESSHLRVGERRGVVSPSKEYTERETQRGGRGGGLERGSETARKEEDKGR